MPDNADEAKDSATAKNPSHESPSSAETPAPDGASLSEVLSAMQAAEEAVSAAIRPGRSGGKPATLVGEVTPHAPTSIDDVTAAMQAAEDAVSQTVQRASNTST